MSALYIVTGAFGHLGNTIVRQLVERGAEVRCLAYNAKQQSVLAGLPIQVILGDVCDKASLMPLFEGIDSRPGLEVYVIHAAGIVSVATKSNPQLEKVNVEGTRCLLEICLEKPIKRFLYVSSVHAIPEPESETCICEVTSFNADRVFGAYAKTKAMATQVVLDSVSRGLDAVIVHPSGIIGPYDYEIGHMTQMIMNYLNGSLHFGVNGGYDFVDVRDVASGILAALELGRTGECYILSNRYISVREILDQLANITGKRRIKLFLPKGVLSIAAGILERLDLMRQKKPIFTTYTLYTLFSRSNFSNDKSRQELGYAPRDIKTTLEDTIHFMTTPSALQKGNGHVF